MTNQIQNAPNNKVGFTSFMNSTIIVQKLNNVLGDKETIKRFSSSIISAVNSNQQLKECTNESILSGALLGEALKLSPSPSLGRFYLVPFKGVAQFIIGYKGYMELAIRSGQYKEINVIEVREGEYLGRDKFSGNPLFEFINDDSIRDTKKIIGYMAHFELINGYSKTIYWSHDKMEKHAKTYSTGYINDLKKNTSYTFWSKDFTGQAFKTMIRQLISKWGIMSIEMQQAYESDMAVINEDGSKDYVDNIDYDIISSEDEKVIEVEESAIEETLIEEKKQEEMSLKDI